MKKLLLIITFAFTLLGFSQPITVSSTSYTVPQLVNNVLINSPCIVASNITWSTGTNFGSTNGIGYFANTNPNFPIQSGIILSTGSAVNSHGPNISTLNDGSALWPGDSNLESALSASGILMDTKNATSLEFDFTPISPNFSFDFIFASEEYGNFQCQYSDAFAFLLTNMNTGVTTNLGVVPGTNLPISVITIRDTQFNSTCPSANLQYFGSFNGGSNVATSATNFNGQTRVMTASSILMPGVPYHIKLVIADGIDPQYDSSIFISADSFNIGQDVLGIDLSIANDNALCFGTNSTLTTGLNAANYSFVWKKDGTLLTGENGATLSINQAGQYSVTYTTLLSSCPPYTDTILVEYYPEIIAANPNPIYKCDNGGSTYTFNLDLNTTVVKQGLDPLTTVTYFISQNNADNNINPLPLLYNSTSGQTIFVRIQQPNSYCYTVKSFQLFSTSPPIANQPQNLVKCSDLNSTNATFDLSQQSTIILNGQSSSLNHVSYYTSLSNANNASNAISSLVSSGQTIYVRVQNSSDVSCFSTTSFNLIVTPSPAVDVLQNVLVCTSYTLPSLINGNYFSEPTGTTLPMFAGDIITESKTIYIFNQPGGPGTCASVSSFEVTIIDENTLTPADVVNCGSYILPNLQYGKYYTAAGAAGSEIPAGTVISTSQVIYYYFISTTIPPCIVNSDFNITILTTIQIGNRNDVFECNSYTLPSLSIGNYYAQPGGIGNPIAAGTILTSSQTIYVKAPTTGAINCSEEDSFEVIIGLNQPSNITQCNGYTLPALPIGNYYTGPMGTGTQIAAGTVINTSSTIYIYAPTTSGVGVNCTNNLFFSLSIAQPQIAILGNVTVCESYSLPNITIGDYYTGIDGSGSRLYPGDLITSTQTIYIFKRLNDDCFNQNSFVVTIIGLPQIDSRSDIDICDQYVLTTLNVGNYYTEPNAMGTMLTAGTIITSSQRIYIYAMSDTIDSCTNQNSFQINIFSTTADTQSNIIACDNFTLPNLSPNNKYYTLSGGPNGTGIEILPGTVITTSQTIYIFKEDQIRTAFTCIDESSFTITINNTPIIPAIANVNVCNSYTLETLSVGNYFTRPNGAGNQLNAGDSITSTQRIYVYAHTATSPDCSSEISFLITVFNVDDLPNVTKCENFTLPNLSVGNYYSSPDGLGPIIDAGTVITSTQTIYIFATSSFLPRCTDESSFTVTIIDTPTANIIPISLTTLCDEDGTNDGLVNFDLALLTPTVLGTQTGSEYTVAYYENYVNASSQTNAVTSSTLSTVYVRVNNTLAPSCYDIKPIRIFVNKLPNPTPVDGAICMDSETGTLLNPYTILSGLSSTINTFIWTNEANVTVGNGNSYVATLPGVYTLVATNIGSGCSSQPLNSSVILSEPAKVSVEVREDFADQQSIIVTATGQGNNFEYQLDNGSFQDSNVFENITSGLHFVTVRDKNGCDDTTVRVVVVNYPKFFTPNSDGYNDTWNIKDLSNQPTATILIYDRYGKILKQIKPSNSGWDGTYNGTILPADDYWFSVSYTDENQVNQEFKAHFAMKR